MYIYPAVFLKCFNYLKYFYSLKKYDLGQTTSSLQTKFCSNYKGQEFFKAMKIPQI